MSRIGYKPIPVPETVTVEIDGSSVSVKGPKGELAWDFSPRMSITQKEGVITIQRANDEYQTKALHGLTRSLLANMVTGASQGFQKTLNLVGVGYRVQQLGEGLNLEVGFSHSVKISPLPGVTLVVEGNNRIHVQGADKQAVGEMAAQIKAVRPPNAYTGKGIRYAGELVRLKPGKASKRN